MSPSFFLPPEPALEVAIWDLSIAYRGNLAAILCSAAGASGCLRGDVWTSAMFPCERNVKSAFHVWRGGRSGQETSDIGDHR